MLDQFVASEARVLLQTLDDSPAADARLTTLLTAPGFDWNRLVLLAERERATSHLVRRLERLPDDAVPHPRVSQLAALDRLAAARGRHLRERLVHSLTELEGAGIDVVLLEGAAVAASLPDLPAPSPLLDAGVLVAPEDVAHAREVLVASGWSASWRPPQAARSHTMPSPLVLEDPSHAGVMVSVHTALAPHARGTFAAFEASRVGRLHGHRVWVPAPHHLIIHLCAHFAWSNGLCRGGWRTFRYLHALAGNADLPWNALVKEAAATDAGPSVFWTLRLAQSLTGLVVPASVVRRLRPRRAAVFATPLERHYATALFPGRGASCPSTALARTLWTLGMAPRLLAVRARPWDVDAMWLTSGNGRSSTVRTPPPRGSGRARLWRRYVAMLLSGVPADGLMESGG